MKFHIYYGHEHENAIGILLIQGKLIYIGRDLFQAYLCQNVNEFLLDCDDGLLLLLFGHLWKGSETFFFFSRSHESLHDYKHNIDNVC